MSELNLKELREEYFHLHVEIKDGLAKLTTAPHDLFEWFRSHFETEREFQKAELEKLQKHFTAKDLELDTVKAELEMSKYTGQSAVNELHKYKQETDEVVRTLNTERDKLREEKNEFIRALKDCIDVLEQVRAERDELRAFVREVKNLSGRKTFPTEKELQETCNQAQELLNSKK